MKWLSEDEMNAEIRRITDEMRQLKEELRNYMPGDSRMHRRQPALPTDDERRLRDVGRVDRSRD
jgi:hypothetical protein